MKARASIAMTLSLLALAGCGEEMAPSKTWPIILGAVDELYGPAQAVRIAELRGRWTDRGISRAAWVDLAQKWNVCDGLGSAKCRMPPGPLEAEGIAGEILADLANGRPRYGQTSPWIGY